MSRIGRMSIAIPAGVICKIGDDNTVTVKGPKGELTQKFHQNMTVKEEAGHLHVERPNDEQENKHHHCYSEKDPYREIRKAL